jgi:hypothetical protein
MGKGECQRTGNSTTYAKQGNEGTMIINKNVKKRRKS